MLGKKLAEAMWFGCGGYVGWVAGLSENKANSAFKLSLSLGLAWTELGNRVNLNKYSVLYRNYLK